MKVYLEPAAERARRMKEDMKPAPGTTPTTTSFDAVPSAAPPTSLPDRETAIAILMDFGISREQAERDYDTAAKRY